MGYNFIPFDRNQQYLLPENMLDWLPEGDLAYFVIDAVGQMDLSAFYLAYRRDGWGGAAYDPRMMVALLIYAYSVGERSSRRIERLCQRDIAFRVISGNSAPDHSTIARFRQGREEAISELFGQVIRLCARAELIDPSVIAVDGTRIGADANLNANRSYDSLKRESEELARKILDEAERVDAEEDRIYGPEGQGGELPQELRDAEARRAWIKERLEEMERQADEAAAKQQKKADEHEERRRAGEKSIGRKPLAAQEVRDRFLAKTKVNTTDPESRIMKVPRGFVQGFNAQAAVTEGQVIVAAYLTQDEADWHHLHPVVDRAAENLTAAGVERSIKSVVADAGYASRDNLLEAERRKKEALEQGASWSEFFIATASSRDLAREMAGGEAEVPGETPSASEGMACAGAPRKKARAKSEAAKRMERKLKTKKGRKAYALRGKTIEPVFGQLKAALRFDRFIRRGFDACSSEWMLMCAVHNLRKLWRFQMSPAVGG